MRHERSDTRPGLRLVAGCVAALGLYAGALSAQQLWSVEEVAPQSAQATVKGDLAASTAAAEDRRTTGLATVRVTYDYLRAGMGYLELPLPDGSMIQVKNAVFEDRGGGDLLWTGEVPGAGYESVLFTFQDGHLIGWFGEPGEPKYVVHAGPDGRGTVEVEEGPSGDWCGTEMGRSDGLSSAQEVASASTDSVPAASSSDTLDILILYTGRTERLWRSIGGPAVGVQQMEDYLNMVFRNGAIPTDANLIAVHWEPTMLRDPLIQAGHREPKYGACFATLRAFSWPEAFWSSVEVADLRRHHAADLVYFVTSVTNIPGSYGLFSGVAGAAQQRSSLEPFVGMSWGEPYGHTFAHEIGHLLGAQHEPYDFRNFEEVQGKAIRPYAFAHVDLDSCGEFDCPSTVMVGSANEPFDKRGKYRADEPYFSSVRHRPNGWTIGIAGERENEKVLKETVGPLSRVGEELHGGEQELRRISARWVDRDKVRVDFLGGATGRGVGLMRFAARDGTNEVFHIGDENVARIVEEGVLSAAVIEGLRPGAAYRISVIPPTHWSDLHWVSALASDAFELEPLNVPRGAPAPPTEVAAEATGPEELRLTWSDNSRSATGYEIWFRRWSGNDPDPFWRLYGEPLASGTRAAEVGGMAAEEQIESTVGGQKVAVGRYSFVVVSYNDLGFGASAPFDFEFLPDAQPKATDSGQVSDCQLRSTGLELDGYLAHMCLETPDGARRRAWDYGLAAEQSGLLYFFGRDNVEVLVKVLDGCAINGHRWVFVAPVTTLAFRLMISELGPGHAGRREVWFYDSELRQQEEIAQLSDGNPKDTTARTVSDTTAFPCTTAEVAAASAASAANRSDTGLTSAGVAPFQAAANSASVGANTDCEPGGPTLALRGGYTVSMCYETYDGLVGDARDWGLDSSQSGLLYFFDRDNVEVLIKVLDGCGVNGHRWVFVAPVTDLAFNLVVESPDGQRWTHANRLGQTADTASDTAAFPCGLSSGLAS